LKSRDGSGDESVVVQRDEGGEDTQSIKGRQSFRLIELSKRRQVDGCETIEEEKGWVGGGKGIDLSEKL
jgi:hypothetical protein